MTTLYATGTSSAGTPLFYAGPQVPDGFSEVEADAYVEALTEARAAAQVAAAAIIMPVSRAQALIQLRRTPSTATGKTLRDDVEAAVAEAGGDVEDWYQFAATWVRDNPYVGQLGTKLGLTDAQIDDLFRQAAKIAA